MSQNSTMKVEEEEGDTNNEVQKGKTKTPPWKQQLKNARRTKGIILSVTKPSYTLQRGIGSSRSELGESLRWQNRSRLHELLRKLVRRHNWDEASGVLSVLLKGTCKERSIWKNRTKYWATMEILKHIKGDFISPRKIQHVYEIWMKKIGSRRSFQMKSEVVVQLEFILFCLTHGNTEDAHQAVLWLMQERKFKSVPILHFVAGLTYCQLWYTAIRKELQLSGLGESYSPMQSEILESRLDMSIENSSGNNAGDIQEDNFPPRHDSSTSIGNNKEIDLEAVDQHREVSMELDDNLHRESPHQNFEPQGFYVNSDGHEGSSLSGHACNMPCASIFNAHGLEPWLLPLRLPHSNGNLENFIYMQKKMHNDYYKSAVKYLQHALYSTPPVFEALLPLIQMLLLGDQVKEALDELEKFVHNSETALPLRIKASLLEHFYRNNYVKLSACFEDILKKDPTCSHSLSRLVSMHQNGDYSAEKLLEMIALHLDATYAECNTWKEFASCFLKLSQCEEDRMSVCLDGNAGGYEERYSICSNRIPGIFTDGMSGKNWRFRCRWWLTRHFSQNILASEIVAGDLQLLTYKAASASHLFGPKFKYVLQALTCLEKENNMEMLSFLQMHMLNSVGFYSTSDKKNNL